MYRLYVIPGSHACRSAMLMLEHKGVPYRRTDFLTLMHPVLARLHGFDSGGERRAAGGRRTPGIRIGDRLGTVPGLAAGQRRISTNQGIARFLDETHPELPLLPVDPVRRAAVEEAEAWANETLQMSARRILGAGALRDPKAFSHASANGRMGYLLYRPRLARELIVPRIARQVFATPRNPDRDPVAELPGLLDQVDSLISDGVIGGAERNVADFMVAPSLALILYRPDVATEFAGRPALELVDRLLPEPSAR